MTELSPSEIQALVQRWAKGEALSADESANLERYRRDALAEFREFTTAFEGVTEEEILAAFFGDERRERKMAARNEDGKLRSHARPRKASAPRP